METVIFLMIIIFLLWLFSGKNLSNKPTYNPPKQLEFDFKDLMAKQAYDKAWVLSQGGDYQNAISEYDQAIRQKPKASYYNNRAHAKSKIGDYAGAIADYDKAIQLSPNEALYFANRGMTYYNNTQNDLARKDWIRSSQLGSSNAKEWLEKYCNPQTQQIQNNSVWIQVAVRSKEEILNDLGITHLYHITHKNNLEKILCNGLLSHAQAHSGFNQVDISDNQVNARRAKKDPIHNRSIHDYVPLYFNPKNPMLFRRRDIQNDLMILAIDRNLILSQNAIFTDGNAASQGSRFFNSIEHLNQINWQCIRGEYWHDYDDGKRIRCAEVLVFPKIGTLSIEKIFCSNLSVCNLVSRQANKFAHIKVEQNNSMHFGNCSDKFSNSI